MNRERELHINRQVAIQSLILQGMKDYLEKEAVATGRGMGVGGPAQQTGGTGSCYCHTCGIEVPHTRGIPCSESRCPKCGGPLTGVAVQKEAQATGQGMGVGGPVQQVGGTDTCYCPKCDITAQHDRGTPCSEIACPKCGGPMTGMAKEAAEKGKELKPGSLKGGKSEPAKKGTKPGSGARFKAVKKKLSGQKGVKDPGALAASIGRAKFGKKKFQKMSKTASINKKAQSLRDWISLLTGGYGRLTTPPAKRAGAAGKINRAAALKAQLLSDTRKANPAQAATTKIRTNVSKEAQLAPSIRSGRLQLFNPLPFFRPQTPKVTPFRNLETGQQGWQYRDYSQPIPGMGTQPQLQKQQQQMVQPQKALPPKTEREDVAPSSGKESPTKSAAGTKAVPGKETSEQATLSKTSGENSGAPENWQELGKLLKKEAQVAVGGPPSKASPENPKHLASFLKKEAQGWFGNFGKYLGATDPKSGKVTYGGDISQPITKEQVTGQAPVYGTPKVETTMPSRGWGSPSTTVTPQVLSPSEPFGPLANFLRNDPRMQAAAAGGAAGYAARPLPPPPASGQAQTQKEIIIPEDTSRDMQAGKMYPMTQAQAQELALKQAGY